MTNSDTDKADDSTDFCVVDPRVEDVPEAEVTDIHLTEVPPVSWLRSGKMTPDSVLLGDSTEGDQTDTDTRDFAAACEARKDTEE